MKQSKHAEIVNAYARLFSGIAGILLQLRLAGLLNAEIISSFIHAILPG